MDETFTIPVRNLSMDWDVYRTADDPQSNPNFDTNACTSFSAVHIVEMTLNWLRVNNQIPSDILTWCTTNGYINTNGKFELSERYIAYLSGTTKSGISQPQSFLTILKYGMIPLKDWSFDPSMNWDSFYTPVPNSLIAKGQEFLQKFSLKFQIPLQNNTGPTDPTWIKQFLTQSPLSITIPQPSHHAVTLYKALDASQVEYGIYDHYVPYEYLVMGNYPITSVARCNVIPIMQSAYSKSFNDSVNNTLNYEGGYTNDPNDPGGETNFGISKKSYPALDIKNLTRDAAIAIYFRDFWTPVHGDAMPEFLAFNVFDTAVNTGISPAIKLMQSALGIVSDGNIGPKTLIAMSKASISVHAGKFAALRVEYYTSLAQFSTYGKTWISRTIGTLINSLGFTSLQ